MNFDYILLKIPFTCLIAGPSGSGKTDLLFKILDNKEKFFDKIPNRIIYCYSEYQPRFNDYKNIYFHNGIIDTSELSENNENLIILDDLMDESSNNKEILHLFTRGSHHKNISVFLMTQNLFSNGKYSRSISLNSHYIILFNNPRDRSQVKYLSRQMYPSNSNFLDECYRDATNKPHGYLFIDNKQSTPNKIRIQSNIIDDNPIVYIEK